MAYEILDHTADVGFRATGGTLSGAFEGATRAFAEIVAYDDPPEATDSVDVSVEAGDLGSLLFDYLDRLVYTQDVKGVVVVDASVTVSEDPPSLDATVRTAPVGDGAYMDIKAPTYSGMRVERTDDGWLLKGVLDI